MAALAGGQSQYSFIYSKLICFATCTDDSGTTAGHSIFTMHSIAVNDNGRRCIVPYPARGAPALAAASIVCFLVATPALNMLYLSRQYAASATAVERERLLAAGQAVLSSWQGTPY